MKKTPQELYDDSNHENHKEYKNADGHRKSMSDISQELDKEYLNNFRDSISIYNTASDTSSNTSDDESTSGDENNDLDFDKTDKKLEAKKKLSKLCLFQHNNSSTASNKSLIAEGINTDSCHTTLCQPKKAPT